MTVAIWLRDTFEPEYIKGSLIDLTNGLNMAQAKGMQFTILDGQDGPVMVETLNITKAKEIDESDAFIGS